MGTSIHLSLLRNTLSLLSIILILNLSFIFLKMLPFKGFVSIFIKVKNNIRLDQQKIYVGLFKKRGIVLSKNGYLFLVICQE